MLTSLKKSLTRNIMNIPGSRTSRKILIFESDDWGALSIPDKLSYNELLRHGIPVDSDPYCLYDNLASHEDIEALFDLLISYRDINNNHPVITANTIVANPDFEKIRESGFQQYFYETIDKTFQRYGSTANALHLWSKGMEEGVFIPQFHGREHLNVKVWLRELQNNNKELMRAFDQNVFSISLSQNIGNRKDCRAALDLCDLADNNHYEMFAEGLAVFEKIFGYRSESFIAPCYTWTSDDERNLSVLGVKILQGSFVQKIPVGAGKAYKKSYNYMGKKNGFGQWYSIRNAFMEPALYNKSDETILNQCLKEITYAYKYGKPAVIGIHRLNFIGSHDIKNRDRTLNLLKALLNTVIIKWPDVEFLSTNQMLSLHNSFYS